MGGDDTDAPTMRLRTHVVAESDDGQPLPLTVRSISPMNSVCGRAYC